MMVGGFLGARGFGGCAHFAAFNKVGELDSHTLTAMKLILITRGCL